MLKKEKIHWEAQLLHSGRDLYQLSYGKLSQYYAKAVDI